MHNLLLETKDHIAWITINRPQQMNALNAETLQEIRAAVEECAAQAEVRVLVLTGAGDKAFVAGADIKAMAAMEFEQAQAFCRLGHACMNAIERAPKPVIAMVNGFALGGGCELALACDWIYASDNARFALPEVTLGLFPGFGGTQRLARIVGKAKALELICSGRQLMAAEASAWGIVNKVVPFSELRGAVEQLAVTIARNSPAAIALAKEAVLGGCNGGLQAGLDLEQQIFPRCFQTQDRVEGLQAFVEKRKPNFTGR